MCFRYDDIGKEFSKEQLAQQDFIDNSIMELINKVSPLKFEIRYQGQFVFKIREALIELFSKELKVCSEKAFYP